MKNKITIAIGFAIALLILIVYKAWFVPGVITGGDLWYFFPSMFSNHSMIPSSWVFSVNNGFGGSSVLFQATDFVMGTMLTIGKLFSLPWEIIERIFILFPFLITSTIFSYLCAKKILKDKQSALVAVLIFLFNTYILMLVSGGLILIGIAYSIIPLLFYLLINIFEYEGKKTKTLFIYSLIMGISFSVQSLIDVRVTYISLTALVIYFFVNVIQAGGYKRYVKPFLFAVLIPLVIDFLINSFWILPAIFFGSNPLVSLGDQYVSINAVKFFSFATLENSFSLLHPNWPENIFGKIYFQKPEFLLLSILAFSSLFFVKKETKKIIVPFLFIAIVSIILAKGTNDPFGGLYILLFKYLPGFVLFRDPTKWYMLIAFCYSILIPYSLLEITYKYKKCGIFTTLFFVIYFIILIYPAILGGLPGTFRTSTLPSEYVMFNSYLVSDNYPSRVLWIPSKSRFSYMSPKHPAVDGNLFFKDYDSLHIAKRINMENQLNILLNNSIRYVAVPSDPRGEIFLNDRKFSKSEYDQTVSELRNVKGLKEINSFGDLKLFEISNWTQENVLKNVETSDTLRLKKWVSIGTWISLFSFYIIIFLVIYFKKYEN